MLPPFSRHPCPLCQRPTRTVAAVRGWRGARESGERFPSTVPPLWANGYWPIADALLISMDAWPIAAFRYVALHPAVPAISIKVERRGDGDIYESNDRSYSVSMFRRAAIFNICFSLLYYSFILLSERRHREFTFFLRSILIICSVIFFIRTWTFFLKCRGSNCLRYIINIVAVNILTWYSRNFDKVNWNVHKTVFREILYDTSRNHIRYQIK